MPRILEQDGYVFFFYSNDHLPMHVHVRYAGGEASFIVEGSIELRASFGLKIQELSKAEALAQENIELIREKWREYFGG